MAILEAKNITPEQLEAQLERHAQGFPYLEVKAAATAGAGIHLLTPQQECEAVSRWEKFLADGGHVAKFVPASGAASRMFKALYEFVDSGQPTAPEGSIPRQIIDRIADVPFLSELKAAVEKMYGRDLDTLLSEGAHRDIIRAIIDPEGMGYGLLPKALLSFHTYSDGPRTPLEEHLTEGAQTAADASGTVHLHFTVSADHHKLFEQKLAEAIPAAEARTGCRFDVTLSEQSPATDTVAANPDGTPFREGDDNHLLFRPGGHGALIGNLSDLDATVVFIKNIDNVVPDTLRDSTVQYKKVLAGTLIQAHDTIMLLLAELQTNPEKGLEKSIRFLTDELCITLPEKFSSMTTAEQIAFVTAKLSRPLRVCGMVRNEGEPGGGPFITRDPDGSYAPQILESHQIDPDNAAYAAMLAGSTHFNPVDLVVYKNDPDGKSFDLRLYTDPSTGFISSKSSHGRELRALELPGLWNGAMSDWNTIFVEVPADTFNPVKTVADLLRPAHQA